MGRYFIKTDKSWLETMADLAETMRLWGIDHWNAIAGISTGKAHKEGRSAEQRRVTLYFQKNGRDVQLTMDSQSRAVDNLRVLYLAVEDMRLNEKRGIGNVLQEAYTQLAALPAPPKKRDPYEVLGVRPDSPWAVIDAAYRALARTHHPDAGGTHEAFKEISAAFEEIKKMRKL